jgi:hypothetical protein
VRPTDENQSSSRRPNLMSSSRRHGGEINILAMLDGQAPGRRRRALPAVFWYGTAGVLACSLLVVLAWLVRGATPIAGADPDRTTHAVPPPGTARSTTTGPRDAAGDRTPVAVPSMHTALDGEAPASATTRGAVIVDVAPEVAPPSAAAHAASGAPSRPQPAAAGHTSTRAAAAATPPARPQLAYRTMPLQTPLLAHGEPAPPRQKRPAAASRTRPPSATVDTDVALISAILQHAGAGNDAADTAATPACADKSCNPRLPSRQ